MIQSAGSVYECALACNADEDCVAFDYEISSGNCDSYKQDPLAPYQGNGNQNFECYTRVSIPEYCPYDMFQGTVEVIVNIQQVLYDIQQHVETLYEEKSSLESLNSVLQTEISTHIANIEQLTIQITNFQTIYTALEAQLLDVQNQLAGLNAENASLKSQVDFLIETEATLVNTIETVSSEIGQIASQIIQERTDVQEIIDLLNTDSSTLEAQVGILSGLVDYLDTDHSKIETERDELQAQVSEYTAQITFMNEQINNIDTVIEAL